MRAQRRTHLPQFVVRRPAGRTTAEVMADLAGLDAGDGARRVRAQLLPDAAAAVRAAVGGEVRLEVGRPQADPRSARQGRRRVGAETEMRRDHRRLLTLDLGLPQHGAPALRQGGERAGDQRGLGGARLPVGAGACARGEFLVGHRHVAPGTLPLPGHAPRDRHQVRAHVVPGPVSPAYGLKHTEEGLRGDIVGLGRVGNEPAGQPPHRGLVLGEQLAERRVVAEAEPLEQPRFVGTGHRIVHLGRHPLRAA